MRRQHTSSPETRPLAVLALLLSAAVSVAILGARNLYDDEILSLPIITSSPRAIIHFAATADVHPPGMYLLTDLAHQLVPSFRWMNLLPTAALYAGLTVFVLGFAPLFRRPASQAVFLLIATLHPQLLLWGTSYRWYSWWTGIALLTVVIAIQPRRPEASFSIARCVSLGLLLAVLLYINYVTLLFAPALAIAIAVRYRALSISQKIRVGLLISTVFLAISAPQLHTLLANQLHRSGSQRSGWISSFAHLAYATLASEAYLPWHPLALICTATIVLILAGARLQKRLPRESDSKTAVAALAAFALCFFLLVGISGLGGRPRNALVLIPIFAAVFARAAEKLPVRIQQVAIVVIAIWSAVGISHMLARTGLAKASMLDRPEQVVAFIQSTQEQCAVVVTDDPLLAFSLAHPRRHGILLLSPFATPIAESAPLPPNCTESHLYVVRSYIGGNRRWTDRIDRELASAARLMLGPSTTASFSFDPDAARKRRLSRIPGLSDLDSAARLPDYRYVVTAGPISASAIERLGAQLPDFCTPDQCPSPVSLER